MVTIHSDFGAQENIICYCSHFFSYICHEVMGLEAMVLVFWILSFKPAFLLCSFTFIKRFFRSSLLSAIRVVSSAYLRLLIFLPAVLIPVWALPSLAFHIMYSACKLNKQSDNIEPWCTPFPILSHSFIPCPILTVDSWPAYRFLRRQIRWSGIPICLRIFQFVVIYTVKGFSIINEADDFLEFLCFPYDPTDVGNLISGFSVFSKSSLYIWKFLVHILLMPTLKDFEHYPASMWNECSYAVVWTFFGIALLWDWNENWPFPVLLPLLFPQICWHIECSTFTASSFRIWNSSASIPSTPLTLLIMMLPKAHLTSHSRMSGMPSWLSGSLRPFLYSSSVYSYHLFCFR